MSAPAINMMPDTRQQERPAGSPFGRREDKGDDTIMSSAEVQAVGLPDTAQADRGAIHPLPFGVVAYDDGLTADNLLARCANDLTEFGYRLGGVVQSNVHRPGRRKCDMYLKDLLSDEEILISSDRGNEARGCRLDPAAFVRIGLWCDHALAEGVDLMMLNKFGKEEAQGRGLRPFIAEALIAGIPVVIGVSTMNLHNLLAFAGNSATRLSPERYAVLAWCHKAIKLRARAELGPRPLRASA